MSTGSLDLVKNGRVRITAKADYAVRAAAVLASAPPGRPVKGATIADAQHIPLNFLENILRELRRAGIVRAQRGADGGYLLAVGSDTVSVADVIRAVEGPLAEIQGERPEQLHYDGAAEALADVWIALRVNIRAVLEHVTLADIANGELPAHVQALLADPDSRKARVR